MQDATDKWVAKINKIAREIDAIENDTHPSVWSELTKELRERYMKAVKR